MAATVRNAKNGAQLTYGSLAYDTGRAARTAERPVRPVDRQIIIPAAPRLKEQAAALPRVKTQQSIAPLAIVGYICAAILIVFSLMAKIQLTEVTDQSAKLEQRLTDMKVAQNRLLINYEKAFNMTEIEEYATTHLGMQRPRDDQIYYIDNTVPDKAEIIDDGKASDSLGERILDALSFIAEYFK